MVENDNITTMVVPEYITDQMTISDVKDEYNKFMDKSREISDEIADVIDVKEMKDISELIKQFNERLEGVVEVKEQSTTEKATGKTIQRLSMIPFLGKIFEDDAAESVESEKKAKTTRVILQEMFDVFTEKSTLLEGAYERAYKLKQILLAKEIELDKFSAQVKYIVLNVDHPLEKVQAIKLGGLVEANKLKNKEKIYNKLDFILQFIEEQLTTISLMMPGIETGLVEDSEIADFLTSVADMNKIFKSLTDLSNSVGRSSSEKVMGLITEVNESMSETIDIDHMEKLASTNKKFMERMVKGTEAKIRRDAQSYGKLMDIGSSLDQNVLAYNDSAKRVLLDSKSYMGSLDAVVEESFEASIIEVQSDPKAQIAAE